MHRHQHGMGGGGRGWRGGRGCGEGGGWRGRHAEGGGWRARRGDVKFFILGVLADSGPRHGYDIMTVMEEKSGGRYRPSPGSVYPTLQLLEDGGFVTAQEVDGKRVFTITDSGRELLKTKPPESEQRPEGDEAHPWEAFGKLGAAVKQAAVHGDPETRKKLRAILTKARKEVYTLLAEGE